MHRAESQLPVSAYGTGMKPRFRTKQSQNIECLRPLMCLRLFYSPFPPPRVGASNGGSGRDTPLPKASKTRTKAADPMAHNARTNGAGGCGQGQIPF